ncbi:MAG TPA: hypothetical protein VM327_09635 [Candidatus Thermoplasmatota archaeon]|nr:hypothetical protein [Candidatus Thermoplasmatota archaeon]
MRLTALLALLVVLSMSAGGCILFRGCDVHTRKAIWTQDEIPVPSHGGGIDYKMGELWGGISRHPDTEQLHLIVHANRSVSHDKLVEFAEALFAERDWPPPQLGSARESESCGDHL